MAPPARLHVLDGTAALFRSWFSVGSMTSPDGTEVGALSGLAAWLGRVVRELAPTHLAIVMDAGPWTFRNEIHPEYKAHRKEHPEELVPQFDLAADLCQALGAAVFRVDGYEADDLMATLSRRARRAGLDVRLLTPDKDVLQVVDDHVLVVDPKDLEERGAGFVRERFGVSPARLVDLLALAGDPTDNIPGIRGIGPKSAAALIDAAGSLEALLEDPDQVASLPIRGAKTFPKKLRDGAADARLSYSLLVLKDDVPLQVNKLGDLRFLGPDSQAGEFFERWGLRMPPLG